MLAVYTLSVSFAPGASVLPGSRVVSRNAALSMEVKPVVIGVAADSGCGKSTFMRRLTSIFGGESKLLDIGRETNTLVSDMTTVICLDDYHKWDRTGRKSNPEWPDGITALHEACQKWDKMAQDVTDLKAGKTVGGHYASPDLGLPFHGYVAGGPEDASDDRRQQHAEVAAAEAATNEHQKLRRSRNT